MSSSQGRTAAANEDHHAGGNHGKDLPDDEENVDTNTTTHNDEPSADKVEVSTEKEAGTLVQQNETADGVDSEDASSRDDSDDDSSSSSSDDSEDGQKLTLMEIREQKMKRNQELLESLGLTKQFLVKKRPPSRTRKSVSNKEEEGEEPAIPRRPRGMLLSVPNGSIPRVSVATSVRLDKETSTESDLTSGERRNAALDALYDRYPHRESQIHRLVGILGAACDCKEAYYIPPPVFLSGPSGTAKTSIARDVLTALCQPTFAGDGERVVAGAYVNCNSLDSLSIEEIVRNAYSQFEEQIVTKHSKKKRKHGGVSLQKKKRQRVVEESSDKTVAKDNASGGTAATVRRGRSHLARAAAVDKSAPRARKSAMNESVLVTSGEGASVAFSAVSRFGRDLSNLFRGRHCGLLVLDHADKLLSLARNRGERPNFLAQLVLLPQTLGLNLSIVAITNSSLLEHSRLNPLQPPQMSLATLSSAIIPISIHFPAYTVKNALKEILSMPHTARLVVGDDIHTSMSSGSFREKVFRSFLDSLLQSIHGTTYDTKEILRLGRKLWPEYIGPLQGSSVSKTIDAARKSLSSASNDNVNTHTIQTIGPEVLKVLDRKFLSTIRRELESGIFYLEDRAVGPRCTHELSPIAKYLLLAAFLCQANKADRDKHLFSIQKNGRRRRQDADRDHDEEAAYGNDAQAGPSSKTLRPKSFPIERMLSVFVSLVGLNKTSSYSDGEEVFRQLGGPAFYETVGLLRDIGLLDEQPSRGASDCTRLSGVRYSTTLMREEAQVLASELNISLDRYIQ